MFYANKRTAYYVIANGEKVCMQFVYVLAPLAVAGCVVCVSQHTLKELCCINWIKHACYYETIER